MCGGLRGLVSANAGRYLVTQAGFGFSFRVAERA
jgi:hypothetical protein